MAAVISGLLDLYFGLKRSSQDFKIDDSRHWANWHSLQIVI